MLKKTASLLFYSLFVIGCSNDQFSEKNLNEVFDVLKYEENMKSMVLVPGGTFIMGTDDKLGENQMVRRGAEEGPLHNVILESFYMDKTEVTNAEFKEFVDETGYVTLAERSFKKEDYPEARPEDLLPAAFVMASPKTNVDIKSESYWSWWKLTPGANWKCPEGPESNLEGKWDHPVVNVGYEDAKAYAKWAGKRLPTEAEWEYAARGGLKGAMYPWGNELLKDGIIMANYWQGDFPNKNTNEDKFLTTSPVKSFPPNNYGLYDLAGNVWEMVADEYEQNYYSRSPMESPKGGIGKSMMQKGKGPIVKERLIRGGSFLCSKDYCTGYRVAARARSDDISASYHTGFRCVMDVKKLSELGYQKK